MSRPLVSLVMMLKDEAAAIRPVLEAARPYIDCFTIVDTGSTDGTPDIVAEVLAGLPGRICHETFLGYKQTRNRALELDAYSEISDEDGARVLATREDRAHFSFMLSADEYLKEGPALRDGLAKLVESDVDAAAVHLTVEGVSRSPAVRIFRTGSGWHYDDADCGVHEFPTHPDPHAKIALLDRVRIDHRAADPEKRLENIEARHIPLLEEALGRNPHNARALVYLAQSYENLFSQMDDWQRTQYAMGALALYMRRMVLPFETEGELRHVRRQFLDTARVAGIFHPDELLIRAEALHKSEPQRPESALQYAIASLGALRKGASDEEIAQVYGRAVHAASLFAEFSADDSGPVSTETGWQAHLLAARAALQLAQNGAQDARPSWADKVRRHAAISIQLGGNPMILLPLAAAVDGKSAKIPISDIR